MWKEYTPHIRKAMDPVKDMLWLIEYVISFSFYQEYVLFNDKLTKTNCLYRSKYLHIHEFAFKF